MSRMLPVPTRAQTAIPTSGGQPLEPTIQARMERAFRHDFSAVRIHQGRTAADLGALAFTSSRDLHFAPGQYDPHGVRGQELIGHELAHVVQQSSGRVQPTTQVRGIAINDDTSLEREADEAGARAARGTAVHEGAVGAASGVSAVEPSAPVQRKADPVIQMVRINFHDEKTGEGGETDTDQLTDEELAQVVNDQEGRYSSEQKLAAWIRLQHAEDRFEDRRLPGPSFEAELVPCGGNTDLLRAGRA